MNASTRLTNIPGLKTCVDFLMYKHIEAGRPAAEMSINQMLVNQPTCDADSMRSAWSSLAQNAIRISSLFCPNHLHIVFCFLLRAGNLIKVRLPQLRDNLRAIMEHPSDLSGKELPHLPAMTTGAPAAPVVMAGMYSSWDSQCLGEFADLRKLALGAVPVARGGDDALVLDVHNRKHAL